MYGVWREEPGDCGKDMGLCIIGHVRWESLVMLF